MNVNKHNDQECQMALDWLKTKIRPRLKYAKGPIRMTEEELDGITLGSDLEDLFRMVWYNWVSDNNIDIPMMGNESPLIDLAPEYDDEMTLSDYEYFGFTFVELLEFIYAGQETGYSFLFLYDNVLMSTIYEFENSLYRLFYSAAVELGYKDDVFDKAYKDRQYGKVCK